jgi:hypothetical protein
MTSASQRIHVDTGEGVCDGAEYAPALLWDASLADIVDLSLASDAHDWLVLVDGVGRPVKLIERVALLLATPFEYPVTRLPPHASRAECLRLARERPAEQRECPLVCCRSGGRYAGIVRVESLRGSSATCERRR